MTLSASQGLGFLLMSMIYNEILPNKFTIYSKHRESCGGGVLIAVNDLLPTVSQVKVPVSNVHICLIFMKYSALSCHFALDSEKN